MARMSVLVTALLLTAGPVSAAGMVQPAPAGIAPGYVAAYNWSGFSAGVHAGMLWGTAGMSGFASSSGIGLSDISSSHGIVGIQAGYLWQTGTYVFGLEADYGWSHLSGSSSYSDGQPVGEGISFGLNWKLDNLGTIRGKAGVAIDNMLLYGTAGLAFGSVSVVNLDGYGAVSSNRTGWTLGAGVDYAITHNVTFGLDFKHVDLGSINFTPVISEQSPVSAFAGKVSTSANELTARLNYKF